MSSGQLSDRKKISLGSKAITLKTFRYKNTTHVFVASDRSTVIYSRNQRLAYRYACVEKVHHMCSFHSKSFPNSIVVVKKDMFTIGSIDDLQHLYISSVTLGEQPYRIFHQASMYLLVYKHEQGGMLEERARDYSANWMTAVEFLDDDIYLGAESNFNIFTAKKNNDAAINDEDQGNSSFLSVSE
jgi:hypothetical protein